MTTKHKIKPVLTRHQLHYLHDIYEDLSKHEGNSLIYAGYAETLQKAIKIVTHYEHVIEHKK